MRVWSILTEFSRVLMLAIRSSSSGMRGFTISKDFLVSLGSGSEILVTAAADGVSARFLPFLSITGSVGEGWDWTSVVVSGVASVTAAALPAPFAT